MARHFQHDVYARSIRAFQHAMLHVASARVADMIGLHRLGQAAAMLVDFKREYLRGAHGARHGDRKQPDRSTPDDCYGLGGDLSGQHRVNRIAEWIEDGGIIGWNGRIELPDVRFGNLDVIGEGTVGIDADDLYVLADMRLAGAALQTFAAIDMHLGGDKIAFLDAGHFATDSGDRSAKFMAGHERWMDALLRPRIPFVNVKVSTAD